MLERPRHEDPGARDELVLVHDWIPGGLCGTGCSVMSWEELVNVGLFVSDRHERARDYSLCRRSEMLKASGQTCEA